MSETLERSRQGEAQRHDYTEDDVERGLTALAYHRSERRASELTGIPKSTLGSWARLHSARLEAIQGRLQEHLAETSESLAYQYALTEQHTLSTFQARQHELAPKDAAQAVKNIATAKAINIDKAALLRGQPTSIVENRSGEDILKRLCQAAPHLVVNGTAEELDDQTPHPSPTSLGPGS